jgi:hypothetical protein
MGSDDPFPIKKKPVSGSFLIQAHIGLILAIGRNKKFTYSRFAGRSQARMCFRLILKFVAVLGASMANYGHFMGPNLGLFWQTEAY